MTSPPTAAKPLQGATNFFGNLFRLRRNKSFGEIRDGSSKRGRRFYEVGCNFSAHSLKYFIHHHFDHKNHVLTLPSQLLPSHFLIFSQYRMISLLAVIPPPDPSYSTWNSLNEVEDLNEVIPPQQTLFLVFNSPL